LNGAFLNIMKMAVKRDIFGSGIPTECDSLNPEWVEQVALATCSTHVCYARYAANFYIKILLETTPFRANHVQLKSLPLGIKVHPRGW